MCWIMTWVDGDSSCGSHYGKSVAPALAECFTRGEAMSEELKKFIQNEIANVQAHLSKLEKLIEDDSSDDRISLDARYQGAWVETASRIQARDSVLATFVTLTAALIAFSLSGEQYAYFSALVGFATLIFAML